MSLLRSLASIGNSLIQKHETKYNSLLHKLIDKICSLLYTLANKSLYVKIYLSTWFVSRTIFCLETGEGAGHAI
jgi:hypothetical protein